MLQVYLSSTIHKKGKLSTDGNENQVHKKLPTQGCMQ